MDSGRESVSGLCGNAGGLTSRNALVGSIGFPLCVRGFVRTADRAGLSASGLGLAGFSGIGGVFPVDPGSERDKSPWFGFPARDGGVWGGVDVVVSHFRNSGAAVVRGDGGVSGAVRAFPGEG